MEELKSKPTKRFYTFGPYQLYAEEAELFRGADPIDLPAKSLNTLVALVSRHGHVVGKDELMKTLWPDTFVEEASLFYQISQLRKTLGERPGEKPYIETVAGRGYRFGASVTESWDEEPAEPQLRVVGPGEEGVEPVRRRLWPAWLGAGVLLAVGLVAGGVFLGMHLHVSPSSETARVRRFTLPLPFPLRIGGGEVHPNVALSPSGESVVFSALGQDRLWVHDLIRGQTFPLEGTEGGDDPFWSPGGEFVAYFAGPEIRKVSVRGGAPTRVCKRQDVSLNPGGIAGALRGGSWSPDGESIVFSEGGSLYEVAARGGTAELLVWSDPDEGEPGLMRWPHFLPVQAGARVLIYTQGSATDRTMIVHDLESGRREALGAGELPFYSPSGHLVYQQGPWDFELWALPFSLDTLRAAGPAFPVAQAGRLPTVAADGTLVFVGSQKETRMIWLDRKGQVSGEILRGRESMRWPQIAPDGDLIALTILEGSNRDVWTYDLARGVSNRLTTAASDERYPVWSPSGTELAFTSVQEQDWEVASLRADGTGSAKLPALGLGRTSISDWSRDGRYVLYEQYSDGAAADIWYLERDRDGGDWKTKAYLEMPEDQCAAKLSPDGRYVAYVSDESGRHEIYIQRFPHGGGKLTVSSNGGRGPRWSRDGKEVFYVEGQTLVAVPVSMEPTLSMGTATRLFQQQGLAWGVELQPEYDVAVDRQKFVVVEPASTPSIHVVQNWYEEFRGREQD